MDHLADWEKQFSQFTNGENDVDDEDYARQLGGDDLDALGDKVDLGFNLDDYMKDIGNREMFDAEGQEVGLEGLNKGFEGMEGYAPPGSGVRFGEDGFPLLGDYAFGESRTKHVAEANRN